MKKLIFATVAMGVGAGLILGNLAAKYLWPAPEPVTIYITEEGPTTEEPPEEDGLGIAIAEYDSQTFTTTFTMARASIQEIRADDFGTGSRGKIEVRFHPGGAALEPEALKNTILAVVQQMPNLRSTPEFLALLYETLAAETGLGREEAATGIKRWKNYGIAQFRPETAVDTLKWLKHIRPDVFRAVMGFYDTGRSITDNLAYNVPFSIALAAQYYWRRVPDIYSNIATVERRGEVWKTAYNTRAGLGTVNNYIARAEAAQ